MACICSYLKSRWHDISRRKGFIVPFLLTVFFDFLRLFSVLECLRYATRRICVTREPSSKWFWRWLSLWRSLNTQLAVEVYVLVSIVIVELIFFFLLWDNPSRASSLLFYWFANILLVLKLVEIFQTWFNIHIIRIAQIASAPRLLVLILINYVELIIIFSVLSLLHQGCFSPEFGCLQNSLLFTLNTLIPFDLSLGINFIPIRLCGYLMFFTEILFTLLFILIVISRTLAYFRPPPH